MKSSFQHIKGTFDILPDPSESDGTVVPGSSAWRWTEDQIRDVFRRFDMKEIRTPILEPTELIARGIGQLTDIVSKEMFAFERGDTNYVLRPEITAPVMRAFLEHRLDQAGGAQKLFYIGPCFRAERPQKGRFRQFHQFGCEIIGASGAAADAEVMAAMMDVYRAFGIRDMRLRINSLGDEQSRPRYREALREYLEPHADRLTETSRGRLQSNPLRILDTKVEHERALLADAPILTDYIDEESRAHYEEVKALLTAIGVAYEEDPFLVRGLDYYTRTAFEVESPLLGAQSALAGGGRYDLLAVELGSGAPVPAVGFAAGMERLLLALTAQGTAIPESPRPDVFLLATGSDAIRWSFGTAIALRRLGLHVATDVQGRSKKAQAREANRKGARWVVYAGQEDKAPGVVSVRDMSSGETNDIAEDRLASFFSEMGLTDTVHVSPAE